MNIVNYIRQNGLDAVTSLGVSVSEDPTLPLVNLSYNIDVDWSRPEVRACRGLILEKDTWKVVARPYDKFFNYGEPFADKINWAKSKIYEKLDGTLAILYFYNGRWRFGTTGTTHAGEFDAKFRVAWSDLNYRWPSNTDMTYLFEYVGPLNKIVVSYDKTDLIFHGVRSNISGLEFNPHEFAKNENVNWRCVTQHDFNSPCLETLLSAANERSGFVNEGFVVVDNHFNRIKIKSDEYVHLHRIKSSTTEYSLLQSVILNDADEIASQFPEFAPRINEFKEYLAYIINSLTSVWNTYKHLESQKEFAISIANYKWSGFLFSKRKNPNKTFAQLIAEQADSKTFLRRFMPNHETLNVN